MLVAVRNLINQKVFALLYQRQGIHLVCLFTVCFCDGVDQLPSTKNFPLSLSVRDKKCKMLKHFTKNLVQNLMAVLIIQHRVVLRLGTSIAYLGIAFLFLHLSQHLENRVVMIFNCCVQVYFCYSTRCNSGPQYCTKFSFGHICNAAQ